MTDLVIIGGGPAGMSAAVAAYESGVRDILILERDEAVCWLLEDEAAEELLRKAPPLLERRTEFEQLSIFQL